METFSDKYEIGIFDTSLVNLSIREIQERIERFSPFLVGLSALTCEAELVHKIAEIVKEINRNTIVVVGGPHASIASEYLLQDKNIDYTVIGEGERTIVELLKALECNDNISVVDGISYRVDNEIVHTKAREYIKDLDTIPFPAWDLIDIKEYTKHPNWNGILKEKYYMPIITSRGCPFSCTFCHNIFGKKFRVRSPENVFSEIITLYQNYGVKEFHIIDDVFNFDAERVKKLCSLIIDAKIKISLAFPNGLRADIMTEELIAMLKKAGTYKINYAIETASSRIQHMIKKGLNIERAQEIIEVTTKKGIITAGYFMLGFPTETIQEMQDTINLAINCNLDIAYFFKVTPYLETELYKTIVKSPFPIPQTVATFSDLHFYSAAQSCAEISIDQLNNLILEAQHKFYLNPKRIIRLMSKSLDKTKLIKGAINMFGLILQAYIIRKLAKIHITP